jgi:hypothetical protein
VHLKFDDSQDRTRRLRGLGLLQVTVSPIATQYVARLLSYQVDTAQKRRTANVKLSPKVGLF